MRTRRKPAASGWRVVETGAILRHGVGRRQPKWNNLDRNHRRDFFRGRRRADRLLVLAEALAALDDRLRGFIRALAGVAGRGAFSAIVDHFVAALEVNDRAVLVGAPLTGLEWWPIEEFTKRWRFQGVVLRRVQNLPAAASPRP